jgi:hypothetical protein
MLDMEGGLEMLETLQKEAAMIINLEQQRKEKCLSVVALFMNASSLLPFCFRKQREPILRGKTKG